MNDDLIIRPAKIEDLKNLLEFEQGVIAAERAFDPTLKEGKIHYYDLAKLIESSQTLVVVAELGPSQMTVVDVARPRLSWSNSVVRPLGSIRRRRSPSASYSKLVSFPPPGFVVSS